MRSRQVRLSSACRKSISWESEETKMETSKKTILQNSSKMPRVYKIKMHGNGRPWDNTVAIVLDISALDPAYFVVRNDADVLTA